MQDENIHLNEDQILSDLQKDEASVKSQPTRDNKERVRTYSGDLDEITIDNRVYSYYDDDDDGDDDKRNWLPFRLTVIGTSASVLIMISTIISASFARIPETIAGQMVSAASQTLLATITGAFGLSQAGSSSGRKKKKRTSSSTPPKE